MYFIFLCCLILGLKLLVRWVSGLNQQFAKLPYSQGYRGFESPPHRFKIPDNIIYSLAY